MKTILIPILVVVTFFEVSAQINTNKYTGFTPQEINELHSGFENEYHIWTAGDDLTRYTFLNMSKYWPHEIIYKKGPVKQLNYNPDPRIDNFIVTDGTEKLTFHDFVNNSLADGLIILHHGEIVFEQYPRMRPYELHNWMSVTKSLVATIVSILEDRNKINSSYPVETYLPVLKETSWEGIKIIDVLNMSSGINCDEAETDRMNPNSCFRNYFSDFFHSYDSNNQIEYLKNMKKLEAPGQTFMYTSVNTDILTKIIERVTAKTFNQILQDEIWNYVGSESNALMLTTKNNGSQSWMGMSSTLRDLARYGLLFTRSGQNPEAPLNVESYLDRIQSDFNPNLRNKVWFFDEKKYNNYHWDDVYDDGDFVKYGMGGQGLYISPSRDIVMAYFGTWNSKKEYGRHIEFSRQLVKSGMFEH
ncbi:MAG TPA: serine hydrolase domain-containing protein [Eudoraea sp.]|nr:serine hydrolase domain-containing protein [Eudoraea sp.]